MNDIDNQYVRNEEDKFRYLYELQQSGETNMYGAGIYLQDEFGIDKKEARKILAFWMTNYKEIAKQLNIEV
jgi:hypothetical protein